LEVPLPSPSPFRWLTLVILAAAPGSAFAQSAASHPLVTNQDAFECFGQVRAVRTLAEAARDNLDVAAAAAKQPRSPEQRRELVGIVRAGVRSQDTALQLVDAVDACVAQLVKPSASWPGARTAMFRMEADAVLERASRFIDRYGQVSKSLAEAARPDAPAAPDPAAELLQKYGAFGETLKQKATATREKMKALGRPAPPAASAPPPG
jgi:hypothetical protein